MSNALRAACWIPAASFSCSVAPGSSASTISRVVAIAPGVANPSASVVSWWRRTQSATAGVYWPLRRSYAWWRSFAPSNQKTTLKSGRGGFEDGSGACPQVGATASPHSRASTKARRRERNMGRGSHGFPASSRRSSFPASSRRSERSRPCPWPLCSLSYHPDPSARTRRRPGRTTLTLGTPLILRLSQHVVEVLGDWTSNRGFLRKPRDSSVVEPVVNGSKARGDLSD